MNEDKNITQIDMRFFQNELLNDLKKLELQLNAKVASVNQIVLTKTGEYDSKFSKIFENLTELISQMAERKYDNERVEELLKMRNKFSDQIIENQSRISIIDKTLENALFRYDKIFLDNLSVPGLIGVGCKFKNCASYFKYIDNDIQVNQKFKEEGITNLKTFSEKVDNRLKKSEGDIAQIMQNVNRICDVKFELFLKKFEEKVLSQENLITQTRLENSKYATDLINASTDLKIQWDKLENIKNEIYGRYDEEIDKFKKLVHVIDRNFKKQQEEFNVFKQRFSQLAEYLKDFKNHSKNYKEMAKNIDFTKKQKLREGYDTDKYDEIGENVKEFIKSPLPRRKKNEFDLDLQEEKKEEENRSTINDEDNNEKQNIPKRTSLSPSPRKTQTYLMKKKKLTELEKINKIAKEGNKRLSNVFSFKNKLKEMNDTNANPLAKKNLNQYYKTELRRQKEAPEEEIKKEKKKSKILLRKKTIVTENNIDLNFDMNKEDGKENEKEPLDNSSTSSNFSLSSIISLKKIGEDSKEEKKGGKNKSIKLPEEDSKDKEKDKKNNNIKDKELFSDKERKSSKDKSYTKSSKIDIEKKTEDIISSSDRDKYREESEKIIQKELMIETNGKKIEFKKNEINNNNKKENNNVINKKAENYNSVRNTPSKNKEIPKKKKEIETQHMFRNNIKPIAKSLRINIPREKSSRINKKPNIENKFKSPILTKRDIAFDKTELRKKTQLNNNNLLTLNNESRNDQSTDKIKHLKTNSVYQKQKKQVMNEYTNKNDNQIIKTIPNKANTEVTFPQIKTISKETNKNQNSQAQKVETKTNTPKENRKIKNKLILGNNKKPFVYNALLTQQRVNTNNNFENKDTMSVSIDKKEEIKESKDNKDINNEETENEENKEIHKEEVNTYVNTNYINTNSNTNNENDINKQKELNDNDKENMNIRNLFNSLYDEIKQIKEINNNNNANKDKDKDNIRNKNAFLTSLNNVNNNYNYYYNNHNLDRSNIIPITNIPQRKSIDEETIKKFNNEIDFINGNIKLVNHRITTLENRYQLILTQLNNIFKTVSTYYHHHRRKMDHQHTLRLNLKKGTYRGKSIDSNNEEILDDKKFMLKLKDIYNDNYENKEELRLNIPNDEYNKTLRRIEPFLIKKFKNN